MGAYEPDVVIVGGGPTGLMLAAELQLAKVDAVVLERRPSQELVGSRAGGLHARTIEILDQRGVAERFLAEGETAQAAGFALKTLDISDFPTRHPYALGLWQNHIERILGEWVAELSAPIRYDSEVTGFDQDRDGVDVQLADGGSIRTRYLVGCDGGRSTIRKAADIDFPGWDPTTSTLIAEAEMSGEPEFGVVRQGDFGVSGLNLLEDGKTIRIIVGERELQTASEPSPTELSEALTVAWGTDFGMHSPVWISRFTDATRQASSYREGRVLLAGDSAHVHYPTGGQGIQNGIQDAVNLGWKLALVIHGTSPESLLDTYQDERHPVTAHSLRHTMAQTALLRGDERIEALRDTVFEMLDMEEPQKRFAGLVSGLGIRYDLGEGHPLLGRRMPDLDLGTPDGPVRTYTLLHAARPLLLNFSEPETLDITPWLDRVQSVDATHDGAWELPVIGEVDPPTAVLVRPDGHVAWVGAGDDAGLSDALDRWFGSPVPA
jgi:2-polyprenyl-6-methoxyphenol hydroxylase-like FAD-dependent oxidoreductase